jgi:hypothetical protein
MDRRSFLALLPVAGALQGAPQARDLSPEELAKLLENPRTCSFWMCATRTKSSSSAAFGDT